MKNFIKISTILLLLTAVTLPQRAQAQEEDPSYYNLDWHFNGLLFNDFSNTPSGWGANFEGGFYITPKLAAGMYVSFHSNNKYVGEQLIHINENSDLFTDQLQQLYQVPFGVLLKYRFIEDGMFEPYVTAKMGAMFAHMASGNQVIEFYHESWGFNVQPEVGITFYPVPEKRVGVHLAAYYSYSTNQTNCLIYNFNGINSIGFLLGLTF